MKTQNTNNKENSDWFNDIDKVEKVRDGIKELATNEKDEATLKVYDEALENLTVRIANHKINKIVDKVKQS